MKGKPKNKLIAVVGPTNSGKTALGVQIAKQYNGIILSADSRQVYAGLDIATNKEGTPTTWQGEPARAVDRVPQLLVDIAQPGERFTLHDWLGEARRLLPKIWAAGQLPVVVGGTGLYVSALLDGYELGEGRGSRRTHPVDFSALLLQLDIPREELYARSDQRVNRLADAIVAETRLLLAQGVDASWLMKLGLDYRFGAEVAEGLSSQAMAASRLQVESRRYIRRQLTWWRHHGSPALITTADQAFQRINQFLAK